MFTICIYASLMLTICMEPKPVVVPQVLQFELPVGRAIDFIAKFELRTHEKTYTAYKDTSGRYSIGYGTRSYEWEVITDQEAYMRYVAVVRQSIKKVREDFPYANEDQVVALTSVFYNCHGGYKKLKEKGIEYHKTKGFCQLPGYGWLVTRRQEERKLLFK